MSAVLREEGPDVAAEFKRGFDAPEPEPDPNYKPSFKLLTAGEFLALPVDREKDKRDRRRQIERWAAAGDAWAKTELEKMNGRKN